VWRKLWDSLKKTAKAENRSVCRSFLADVIHVSWLDEGRAKNIASAEKFLAQSGKEIKRSMLSGLPTPRGNPPRVTYTSFTPRDGEKRDLTEAEIVAGYSRPMKKQRAL
jgi:hypothetical protein